MTSYLMRRFAKIKRTISSERAASVVEYIGMGVVILALVFAIYAVLGGSGGVGIGTAISNAMDRMTFVFGGGGGGSMPTGGGIPPEISGPDEADTDTADTSAPATGIARWIAILLGKADPDSPETGEATPSDSGAKGGETEQPTTDNPSLIERLMNWLRPGSPETGEANPSDSESGPSETGQPTTDNPSLFDRIKGGIDGAKDWFSDKIDGAKDWFGEKINDFGNWLSDSAWPWLKDAGGRVWDFITKTIPEKWNQLRNWVNGLPSWVKWTVGIVLVGAAIIGGALLSGFVGIALILGGIAMALFGVFSRVMTGDLLLFDAIVFGLGVFLTLILMHFEGVFIRIITKGIIANLGVSGLSAGWVAFGVKVIEAFSLDIARKVLFGEPLTPISIAISLVFAVTFAFLGTFTAFKHLVVGDAMKFTFEGIVNLLANFLGRLRRQHSGGGSAG